MSKKSSRSAPPESTASLGYSFIRFSSREQRKGGSRKRQMMAAAEWCEKHKVRLDTSTTLHHVGSAWTGEHRKNPDRHALAAFLKMAEDRKIPRGSYLIVENLDRLTREHLRAAVTLFLQIQNQGINIVTTDPEKVYRHDSEDMIDIIIAVVELARGHAESKRKSDMVGKAWREKRLAAKEGRTQPVFREERVGGMKLLTHMLPLWLEEDGGAIRPIPERVKVVRRIFDLAAKGYGLTTLIRKLNEEKHQPFGTKERYEDEDGEQRYRAPKGQRFGAGRWTKPYVARILRDRRVLGEYQPMDHGKPDGEPIPDYYPQVIKPELFDQVCANRKPGLKNVTTRVGKHIDLFAGLLRDARGGNYVASTRHQRILINNTSLDGRDKARTFPLEVFERAVIAELREVEPKEIAGGDDDTPDEATLLETRKAGIEASLDSIETEMDEHGETPRLLARLRRRQAELNEVTDALAAAKARAPSQVGATWVEFRSLADVLDASPNPTDTRVRLRAALRRAVKEAVLLVVPRGAGRERMCTVQFWFEGGAYRTFTIAYRSGSNGREARWVSLTSKYPDDARSGFLYDEVDLRQELRTYYETLPATVPNACEGGVIDGWRAWAEHLETYPKHVLDLLFRNRGRAV